MKKLLLASLLIIGSVNIYGRVIARPARIHMSKPSVRTISRPSVVRVKPSTRIVTHKAAIKSTAIKPTKTSSIKYTSPKSNSFIVKPIPIRPKTNISSSFSNNGSEPIVIRNNDMDLFDYMLINNMINHNTVKSVQVEGKLNENNIVELIKFLKKEIEEEENKMFPDKEKIKKYKEYINLLQNKK